MSIITRAYRIQSHRCMQSEVMALRDPIDFQALLFCLLRRKTVESGGGLLGGFFCGVH